MKEIVNLSIVYYEGEATPWYVKNFGVDYGRYDTQNEAWDRLVELAKIWR